MVAYIDLIIVQNFCMNFLILFTTGKLLNRKIGKIRIVIASCIGVLYTFSLWLNVPGSIINVLKIIMAVCLVKICFGSKGIKNIAKEVLVFFFISFIYAGCALAFIYFTKPKILYIVNGIIIGGEYIFELVLLSAVISLVITRASMKLIKIKQRLTKKDMICGLKIINGSKGIRVNAFLDTGNLLVDPNTKEPVIVSEYEKIKTIIPENHRKQISYLMGGEDDLDTENFNTKIRAIPYASIGNPNGLIIAYKVDFVEVEYKDEKRIIKNVLLGLCNKALSKDNKYSALIGLKILEGGIEENESNSDIKDQSKCSIC